MDCSTEFIDFICEVLAPLGEVRSRKMMGDYVIYVNDKCVITACDNNAFIKKSIASRHLWLMPRQVALTKAQKRLTYLTFQTNAKPEK